jgi:archaemetzincin
VRIGILPVGQIAPETLLEVAQGLVKLFPDTTCSVINETLPLPEQAYEKKRKQYNSSVILNELRVYATKNESYDRILGLVDADVFASGLNYVFGEAYAPGKAALISIWRLRPEFYGEKPDNSVLELRSLKEAIHELGHTLGLRHCRSAFCVMHFSNSIFDTDKKQSLLCDQCYLQAALAISNLG